MPIIAYKSCDKRNYQRYVCDNDMYSSHNTFFQIGSLGGFNINDRSKYVSLPSSSDLSAESEKSLSMLLPLSEGKISVGGVNREFRLSSV